MEHYILTAGITGPYGSVGWTWRVEHDKMGKLAESPPGYRWPGPFDALCAARTKMSEIAERISRD